jgi:oligopeptide transport system ATP-binding protein
MATPLLEVQNLSVRFDLGGFFFRSRPIRAVDDVSFSIAPREVMGLVGDSGSGKTTIGNAVLRLIEPTAGRILFQGQDVTSAPEGELRNFRRRVQPIFQDPYGSLDPRMTIEAILTEPLIIHGIGRTRPERRERAAELLRLVGLATDALRRYPHQFSGGQRQRIGIARALALEPALIVADEAVSALDVSLQAQIVNLLCELQQRLGLAVLFIAHDLAVVEYISDRVIVLYLGRVMETAPARDLYRRPRHPYTEALLSAVLDPGSGSTRERILLQGDPPSPANPPSGCVFRTRCRYALSACAEAVPSLRTIHRATPLLASETISSWPTQPIHDLVPLPAAHHPSLNRILRVIIPRHNVVPRRHQPVQRRLIFRPRFHRQCRQLILPLQTRPETADNRRHNPVVQYTPNRPLHQRHATPFRMRLQRP